MLRLYVNIVEVYVNTVEAVRVIEVIAVE